LGKRGCFPKVSTCQPGSGKDLAGIQYSLRIKGLLDTRHEVKACLGYLHSEIRCLGNPDTVLPCDGPPHFNHLFKEFLHNNLGIFQLTGRFPVKHDIDVDIPVARMAEGGDRQTVLGGQVI